MKTYMIIFILLFVNSLARYACSKSFGANFLPEESILQHYLNTSHLHQIIVKRQLGNAYIYEDINETTTPVLPTTVVPPFQVFPATSRPSIVAPLFQRDAYCISIDNDLLCSSGIYQGLVEADLSCSTNTFHESAYKNCARSENGRFCGSLVNLYQFNFGGTGWQILERNCLRRDVLNGFCSRTCCLFLEDFKSKLGCCINEMRNIKWLLWTFIYYFGLQTVEFMWCSSTC